MAPKGLFGLIGKINKTRFFKIAKTYIDLLDHKENY